jgi:hypothetical protein
MSFWAWAVSNMTKLFPRPIVRALVLHVGTSCRHLIAFLRASVVKSLLTFPPVPGPLCR